MQFHFITFILKSTSGNVSLFTKYAPELAPSCNIATCGQNGRDIKSGDTIDIYLSGLLARRQNAWLQDGGNMRVIANGVNR